MFALTPALRGLNVATTAVFAAIAVLFSGIALRCMNYDLRTDEALYVPPIRLLGDFGLYRDFFYNHVPGSAWYFYLIGLLTGSDHMLAVGRLGVLIAWAVMIAAIFLVVRRLTNSTIMAGSAVVLTLANELFLTQPGMAATNNFLPLPLTFLGISLFLIGMQAERGKPWLAFFAGICLAAASSFKISAAAVIPIIAIASLLLPPRLEFVSRLLRTTVPLAAGGIIGAIPILLYLLSDPQTFLAHVVGFHLGPQVEFWTGAATDGAGPAITFGEKALLAHSLYLGNAVLLVIGAVVSLAFLSVHEPAGRSGRGSSPRQLIYIVVACAALSAVMAFVPTPGFPQYYTPPLILLPLLLALLYLEIAPHYRAPAETITLALAFVALIAAVPRMAQDMQKIAAPQRWTVNQVHDWGVVIADRLRAAGLTGKVATLAPIYPLEGGLPVYLELATGPFAYRSVDLADRELTSHYRVTSPATVISLLEADPPAAVLLGFDRQLEQPMQDFVDGNGYQASPDLGIKDRRGTPVLYLRPH